MVLKLNEQGELVDDDEAPTSKPIPKKKSGSSKPSVIKKEEPKSIEIVDSRGNPCDLHTLIVRGETENALELIAAGYDIQGKDIDHATPLHHACYNGQKDIVKVLLEEGAEINAKDKDGATPLHHASFNGHLDIVKLLCKKKANVNVKDMDGGTPVHNACYNGHANVLKELFERGGDLNARDADKSSPLHYCSFRGKIDCANFLIQQKVDIDAQDKEGATPLHHACFNGNTEICKILLKAGAKVNVTDHLGGTPLMSATYNKHSDCVVALLAAKDININAKDNDEGANPLHKAAFVGDVAIMTLLINAGASINAQDNEGATPLHKASFSGSVEAIEKLLEMGANVGNKDSDGGTPLVNAVYNGHAGVAAVLINNKADVNCLDNEGRTPLHIAACFGLQECITVLLDKGAKTGIQDDNGATPLHMAAFNGQHFAVAMLLDRGAEPNTKTNSGSVALHFACYKGHLATVIYLVSKGAEVNIQDAKGITPLQSASVDDHTDIVAFLMYKKVKLDAQNKFGMTALHYAVKNGCGKTAYMLMEKGSNPDTKDKKGVTPKELARQSKDEDIKVIFKFIQEESNPFTPEAKSRLFVTLDERKSDLPEVNKQLENYTNLMDPTVEKKALVQAVLPVKKKNAFADHGIPFDINDPLDMCEAIDKEAKKLNRNNTFLNILRHLLLIPSNSSVANKIWNLLEVFIHGCVVLHDEQDETPDEIKVKFAEWKKMFQSRNRIDIDQKLAAISVISEALTILFPNLDFEHESFEEEEEAASFDPTELPTEEIKPSALKNKEKASAIHTEEDDDLEGLDEEEESLEKRSGFVDTGTGAFDLSAIRFEEDEGSSAASNTENIAASEMKSVEGPPPPPPPPPVGFDGSGIPPPPPIPGGSDGAPLPPGFVPPPLPGAPTEKFKIKLKKFNWDKIPGHRIKETFWKSVKNTSIKLDRRILEKYFYVKEKSAEKGPEASKTKTIINLVDIKRANNVGILLSRIKVPIPEIRTALENLDDKTLSVENARALLRLAPSPDETDMLKGYKGDKERLGKTEQFFFEIMEIPRLQNRLECFLYKREFINKVSELTEDINGINDACRRVGNSKMLKQVLQIILAVGNSMNSGTFGGAAQGFKISSVLKVKDTKSDTGKYTLLHYTVSLIEEKKPELLLWYEEVPNIKPGTKDRLTTIEAEFSSLKKGAQLIEEELKEVKPNDPFKKLMTDFLPIARNEVVRIETDVKQMRKGFDDVASYYGEEPGTDVPAIVLEFITHFTGAHTDNQQAKAHAQKAAQKKMQQSKNKRKGLVEKQAKTGKSAKSLLGENHVEMRKRIQKNRASKTKRDTKSMDAGEMSMESQN